MVGMDDDFEVVLMFPDEYRDFIAEISYKGKYVCTINQEAGPFAFSIEFDNTSNQMPLDGYIAAVEHAKDRLRDLEKEH
jgi:hypothetical protein